MKWWYWLILELLIIFGVMAWIYFFPDEIEYDFAKGMVGIVLLYAIEECKDINRRKVMSENYTIEQNTGENRIEGGVVGISGSVNIPDIKRECKTCKNPYCSRTLEERQNREVQAHRQYAWECEDKEKYVQNDGGFVLTKKSNLKDQLQSYESYINDIPNVIDPCNQCKVYIEHNDQWDIGDRLVDGVWKKGECDDCCWCYSSKFEVGV